MSSLLNNVIKCIAKANIYQRSTIFFSSLLISLSLPLTLAVPFAVSLIFHAQHINIHSHTHAIKLPKIKASCKRTPEKKSNFSPTTSTACLASSNEFPAYEIESTHINMYPCIPLYQINKYFVIHACMYDYKFTGMCAHIYVCSYGSMRFLSCCLKWMDGCLVNYWIMHFSLCVYIF